MSSPEVIVIGSGPNGLTAGIILARAGYEVVLYEAAAQAGGGMRTEELTLPGVLHDVCSAVHPLAVASPAFHTFELERHGLEWIQPSTLLAHPFDGGHAVALERNIDATAAGLGADERNYIKAFDSFSRQAPFLLKEILAPLHLPNSPFLYGRFGLQALQSVQTWVQGHFQTPEARALFAGIAAHSALNLNAPLGAAVGLLLTIAGHAYGWPFPRGGSQRLANALVACFKEAGGTLLLNHRIESIAGLPASSLILCDLTPRQLLKLCGEQLPTKYRRSLMKFRYGPAVFKIDWTLSGPVPWKAAACLRAPTIHLGGGFEELARSEAQVNRGIPPDRPYMLVGQPSLFDGERTQDRRHTLWAYCHVPARCEEDMTARMETQIERFAPGFRHLILARHVMNPAAVEAHNSNNVDGGISGGLMDARQAFMRPLLTWNPYRTPHPRIFLCSSSTPPGPGVHGMCGYHAALSVLSCLRKRRHSSSPAKWIHANDRRRGPRTTDSDKL